MPTEGNDTLSVTLQEVAQAAGVSLATASRALTQSNHPIRPQTRQRVLDLAHSLGYRPNLVARSMRTERTRTIGIIADDLLSPFTPSIIQGIQDYLKTFDYLGLIVNTDMDVALEQEAIGTLLSRAVEGIIFVESKHRSPTQELERSQKPYMFVHRLFAAPVRNSVVPDDFEGATLAVEHLLSLGHQQIAHISGPMGWHSARQRVEGYKATLTRHNLPVEPHLLVEGDWEFEGGAAALRTLLAQGAAPTAIFVGNDAMAVGAIDALRQAGLRTPADIAIVGYDNRDFCRLLRPQLTTVSLPTYSMGQEAARLLFQAIQGRGQADALANPAEKTEVKIGSQLYIRESCGAPVGMRTVEDLNVATTARRQLVSLPLDSVLPNSILQDGALVAQPKSVPV